MKRKCIECGKTFEAEEPSELECNDCCEVLWDLPDVNTEDEE